MQNMIAVTDMKTAEEFLDDKIKNKSFPVFLYDNQEIIDLLEEYASQKQLEIKLPSNEDIWKYVQELTYYYDNFDTISLLKGALWAIEEIRILNKII